MVGSDRAYLVAPERKRPYAEVALNETNHANLGSLPDSKRLKINETGPKSRDSLASSCKKANAAAHAYDGGQASNPDNVERGKEIVDGSAQSWHHLKLTAGAPPSINWNAGSKANIRISFGRGSVRSSKNESPGIHNVEEISGGRQPQEQQVNNQVDHSPSSDRLLSLQQRPTPKHEESNQVPNLRVNDTVLRASTNDQGGLGLTATELKREKPVNLFPPTPIPTDDDANSRLDNFTGGKTKFRQLYSDVESEGGVLLRLKTSEDESGEISEPEGRTLDVDGTAAKLPSDLNFAKTVATRSESTDDDALMIYSNSNPMSETTEYGRAPSARADIQRQVPRLLSDLNPDELKLQIRYFYLTRSPDTVAPSNPVRCLVCAQIGHMAEACTLLTCAVCGKYDQHFTKDCAQVKRCGKCRERGHPTSECRRILRPGHEPSVICDLCQRSGHIEDDCELVWRTSGRPWESDFGDSSIRLGCYECGRSGHLGNDCPTRRPRKGLGTSSWSFNGTSRLSMGSGGGIMIKGRAAQQKAMALDDSDDDAANFLRPKVPEPNRKGQIHVAAQSFSRRPMGFAPSESSGWDERYGGEVSTRRDNRGYNSRPQTSPRYSERGSYRNSSATQPPVPHEEPPGRAWRNISHQSNWSNQADESHRPIQGSSRR